MCEIMDDKCCSTCGHNKSDNEDVAICEKILGQREEKAIDDYCSCYDGDRAPVAFMVTG